MSRAVSEEEARSRHVKKDLCFICTEKNIAQVSIIHGEKNTIKRLVVLLVTTSSFNNFTYFEFSKLLEVTGQNENAFLSKQIKVTSGKLNPSDTLTESVKKMCLLMGLITKNPICTLYSQDLLEYV